MFFPSLIVYRASASSPSSTLESDSGSLIMTVTGVPPSGRMVTLIALTSILLTQPFTLPALCDITGVARVSTTTAANVAKVILFMLTTCSRICTQSETVIVKP